MASMEDQNKNLILATVLSVLVILVWLVLFPAPKTGGGPQRADAHDDDRSPDPACRSRGQRGTPDATAAEAVPEAPRLQIETPRVVGLHFACWGAGSTICR